MECTLMISVKVSENQIITTTISEKSMDLAIYQIHHEFMDRNGRRSPTHFGKGFVIFNLCFRGCGSEDRRSFSM